MLDILKGVANLLGGPVSSAVDLAGGALGLPPVLTNSIKTVAGVMTGNVMMAAGGALGVAEELTKHPPAKTEYRAPKDTARACDGYAPTSQALPPARSPLDPRLLDYESALKTVEANFGYLDMLDGRKDGSLSRADLQRIAAGECSVSPSLRDAAKVLLSDAARFEQLDTAQGVFGGLLATIAAGRNDDRINVLNLRSALKQLQSDFAKYGRPERPGSSTPCPPGAPPGTGGTPTPGSTPECGPGGASTPGGTSTSGTGGASTPRGPSTSGGALDPDFEGYRDALRVLDQNWDTFDTAVGKKDGKLTMANFDALLLNPAASATLKRAAQFFKDHPEYFARLEMAAGIGGRDGTASRKDLTAALQGAASVPEPVSTSSSTSGTRPSLGSSSKVKDILDNPNMSIEEKIQAVLMVITEDTDEELLDVMKDMASVRDERAKLGTSQQDKERSAKLDTSMQELELRLQKLMEKRKAMFDLMSNMSSKFNEMAKTAISNLRSA